MSQFNRLLVWSNATPVRWFLFLRNIRLSIFNYSVDWSALYPEDHYRKQEEIYKAIRPTLLSNTLVVPTERIREHILDLSANNYRAIRQQVEGFHRTNQKTTSRKFPMAICIMKDSFRISSISHTSGCD